MKLFIKILLLLLLPAFVHAQLQFNQLDSLRLALKNAANDTVRMDVHSQLGALYLETNRDSALYHVDQSILIAQKLKLKINEAYPSALKGFVLMKFYGNYPKSLETLLQAQKITEDPASERNAWIPPAVLQFTGPSPRNYRLDILGYTHISLGILYGATGNSEKQIAGFFTALSLAESVKDTFLMSVAYLDLGGAYMSTEKLDSSLFFLQKAIYFITNLPSGQRKYQGATLAFIGDNYLRKGNFKEARHTYLKAEAACKEHNNLTDLQHIYTGMTHLNIRTNNPDSSLFYATKALEIAQTENQPQYIAGSYWLLYFAYRNRKNSDSTLKYLDLFNSLNDSLTKVERKNLLAYQNVGFDEQIRLQKLEEEKIQTQTRIKTYAMLASLAVFFIIGLMLYRNNSQKQKANKVLESTLNNLKATQSQLIQSEKMASLGELTAGIAHEIQNPLNFVNNFSEVNKELLSEMRQEIGKKNFDEVSVLAKDVEENEEKIIFHGKRADSIVKSMLQHSRSSNNKKEPTDINALCDEYLRLAFHGLKAKDKSFNASMVTEFDESIGIINIVPQDIGRVVLNLINNAFYAVDEKKKRTGDGYEPTVSVSTKKNDDRVEITVKDNGSGIPLKIVDKIFQPFFTTKPTGQGTGLGLSLSYDIVKAHGGEMKVETQEGEGTKFIIVLPV